jgi:hypothetical protein
MKKQNPAPEAPLLAPPEKLAVHWKRALFWHGAGFIIIVALLWTDEIFNLKFHLFGGEPEEINFLRVTATSGVLIVLWMFSAYKIYQVVSRLTYLESFLRICSWCHKLQADKEWLAVEYYFAQETGRKMSHGICPACAAKFAANLGRTLDPVGVEPAPTPPAEP